MWSVITVPEVLCGGWGRKGGGLTLEAGLLGDVEDCMLRSKGVLGIGAAAGGNFVQGTDTVSGLELEDVGANLFDDASEIVARVGGYAAHLWELVVFGVRPRDHDFDEHLVVIWFGNWAIDDLDSRPCNG
jgi:hypothetical protein